MFRILLFIICMVALSCSTSKDVVYTPPVDYEETLLDTLTVSAPVFEEEDYTLPVYHPAATLNYDLLHTKLELAFDWENQHVLGKAYLDLTPTFYPIDHVTLDAKQFIIKTVKMGSTTLKYTYDDSKLDITLDRKYKKGEKLKLYIDYTARPNEGPQGGSSAITSDKGLFFINPTNAVEDKPRQIWTQGETENNSKWFPTFDKPNERCTQEIFITVEEGLETLSNGTLVSSIKNNDGTKTDYWKMDKAHAPYLFMLAIGDYARVKDSWNGKLLEYLVDPPYKDDAKEIFNHTPEMLSFFSKILDYPYPWDKYSQVIAEDYVSGAMENTTAVIFGDFVQKTKRELIDNENDQIVAHEMFHHWFGDLVTCESWSNLTLNEGFANYSEYLWYEHKYGKDAADAIRMSEMEGYFYMAQQGGTHPLIHFSYDDKEDMFDAHSYNKGGLVLHMLRNYVGDEAFFASLNKYLRDNEYTAVEVDELRLAFEDVTGMDLNWFFDQWYLDKGHPTLNVRYTYGADQVAIYVDQVQEAESHKPVFILPLTAAVYYQDGSISYHEVTVDSRQDTIRIDDLRGQVVAAVLDGKAILLGDIKEDRSDDEWSIILNSSPNYLDKAIAHNNIGNTLNEQQVNKLLNEKFHGLRSRGIESAGNEASKMLMSMITSDPHSAVRLAALNKYETIVGAEVMSIAEQVFHSDQAFPVIGEALRIINIHNKAKALELGEKVIKDNPQGMISMLSDIFAQSGDSKYLSYIENNLGKVNIYQLFNVFGNYGKLLLAQSPDMMMEKSVALKEMAINDGSIYTRYMATKTIHDIKSHFEQKLADNTTGDVEQVKQYVSTIKTTIQDIISNEKDEGLKSRYLSF